MVDYQGNMEDLNKFLIECNPDLIVDHCSIYLNENSIMYKNIDTNTVSVSDFDLPPVYSQGGTTVIESVLINNKIEARRDIIVPTQYYFFAKNEICSKYYLYF